MLKYSVTRSRHFIHKIEEGYIMASKKIVMLTLLVLIFGAPGCGSDNDSSDRYVSGNIYIVYKKGGGLSISEITVTIDSIGFMQGVEVNKSTNEQTMQTGQISPDDLAVFHGLVMNANLFLLRDEYICSINCPSDLPVTVLDITIDDSTKSITFNTDVPEELGKVVLMIEEFRSILN